MSITTRTGDDGTTALFNGQRVPKHHPRLEFIGVTDELTAVLGLAISAVGSGYVKGHLERIQRLILDVNSVVACFEVENSVLDGHLGYLDELCSGIEERIEMPKTFVLPSGQGVSLIELARAKARTAERAMSRMVSQGEDIPAVIQKITNRMSDALWLLARAEEQGL